MPALLTSGPTTLTPIVLSGYSSNQAAGTILHPILGRAAADATLRPAGLRTGTFVLDFATEAESENARALLSASAVWVLTHSEQTTLNMRFIVRQLSREVAGDGRWPVSLSFEEIP